MHIVDTIFYWAKSDPHRLAVIQPEMVTTYQALADAIETIGERIDQLGLDRREPVAVSLANPSYLIPTVLAVLRSGYTAALVTPPLFPLLSPAGIRNLIYDTHGQVLSGGRNIRFDMSWLPLADAKTARRPYRNRPAETGNMIFFTSGTTGLPKKIVQSTAALDELLKSSFTVTAGPYEKILIMPGLASTFGFNRTCETFNFGKTACFAPDNETVLSLVSIFGIEVITGSAGQVLGLAEAKKKNPNYILDSLKAVLVGGGKIGRGRIATVRKTLCRALLSVYSSTEAGVAAQGPLELAEDIPGAVGFVVPGAEVEIVNESGQVLPPRAEGFIRYRTPRLIENLRVSEALPNVRGGWFYPGDVGSLTEDGVLCVAERTSDVINRGGVKISGTRIEQLLQALPHVKEAAACGVAGPSGLEEVWVAIVPNGPVEIEELKRHLREHNDIRIAPDEVFVIDEIPRGALGKVQKYRLKELMLSRKRST
jgi:acyl-coenzyme A synthetase/AMP-(fatty) acid ligase